MTSPAPAVVGMYSFTSPDAARLASFWGRLMGLPVADGASPEFAMLDLHHEVGPVTWMFERDTEARPSTRLGLDIHGADDSDTDWRTVADRAESLGATRLSEHEQDGVRWIVMTGPDGNRFRAFAPRPTTP